MPERVVYQMRVRPETRNHLDYIKKCNPDLYWDKILESFLQTYKMPKPQCASVKEPPKIAATVNITKEGRETTIGETGEPKPETTPTALQVVT